VKNLLLIYPPLVKACEPPVGIARLTACVRHQGVHCDVWDANWQGQMALLQCSTQTGQELPRTRQARSRMQKDLDYLRQPHGYGSFDRYQLAVHRLNHLMRVAAKPFSCAAGLADFLHQRLQPVVSDDLLQAAEHPEELPFHSFFQEQLQRRLAQNCPDLIGVSLNYLSQALCAFSLIGMLRRMIPHIPVMLGGGLITSWMCRPGWRNPFAGLVDDLVAGPGETALLRRLSIADPPAAVPPDYDPLPLQRYFSPGITLPYSASFGCYWNRCAFCPEKAEGRRFQPQTMNRISRDLETLVHRHHPRLLHLTDNALSPRLLHHLIDHPPNAPWYGFTRITAALADVDFCRSLKKAGCVLLKLGVESGDDGVLNGMNKGHSVALASRVLHQLHNAGIAAFVYLLFGTPWEDESAAQATLEFVVRHQREITFINPAIFNQPIEPGQPAQPFYGGDLSLYTDYEHPRAWSRSLVRRFLDRSFKRHPAVAAILRRTPPFFTSNHAPFFCQQEESAQ